MKFLISWLILTTTFHAAASVTRRLNLDQKVLCEDAFTVGPHPEATSHRRARNTYKLMLEGLQVIRTDVQMEVVPGLMPAATAEFFSSATYWGNTAEIFDADRSNIDRSQPISLRFRMAPTAAGRNDWEPELEIFHDAHQVESQKPLGLVVGKRSPIFQWKDIGARGGEVGFVADPHLAAVERRFVSFARLKNDDIVVTIGVDVECHKLYLFRQDRNFTNEIFNKHTLCRVPVLRGVF